MSDILPHQSDNRSSLAQDTFLWQMRWFFAVLLAFWLTMAIAAPIIVFCITRSLLSFALFTNIAPPSYLLYRFLRFLLPMSKEELDLELCRAELQLEHQRAKNAKKNGDLARMHLTGGKNLGNVEHR